MKRSPIAFGFALLRLAGSGPAMGTAEENDHPAAATTGQQLCGSCGH